MAWVKCHGMSKWPISDKDESFVFVLLSLILCTFSFKLLFWLHHISLRKKIIDIFQFSEHFDSSIRVIRMKQDRIYPNSRSPYGHVSDTINYWHTGSDTAVTVAKKVLPKTVVRIRKKWQREKNQKYYVLGLDLILLQSTLRVSYYISPAIIIYRKCFWFEKNLCIRHYFQRY